MEISMVTQDSRLGLSEGKSRRDINAHCRDIDYVQ